MFPLAAQVQTCSPDFGFFPSLDPQLVCNLLLKLIPVCVSDPTPALPALSAPSLREDNTLLFECEYV